MQILAYTQTLAAVSESAASSNGCVECGTTEKSGAFSYCAVAMRRNVMFGTQNIGHTWPAQVGPNTVFHNAY